MRASAKHACTGPHLVSEMFDHRYLDWFGKLQLLIAFLPVMIWGNLSARLVWISAQKPQHVPPGSGRIACHIVEKEMSKFQVRRSSPPALHDTRWICHLFNGRRVLKI